MLKSTLLMRSIPRVAKVGVVNNMRNGGSPGAEWGGADFAISRRWVGREAQVFGRNKYGEWRTLTQLKRKVNAESIAYRIDRFPALR